MRVVNTNSYYYPDLLVTCARTPEAMYLTAVTVEDPVLVIEILLREIYEGVPIDVLTRESGKP